MPLTPNDVANKQFRVGFRGYSVDEVDGFLDEVEAELKRLLTAASTSGPVPTPTPAPPRADSTAVVTPPDDAVQPASLEGQEAALRTLLLAQRTADEAVAEARAEAEQIRTAAREEASAAVTQAREQAETTLARSREDAGRLQQELEQRRAEALDDLERRRQSLQASVEELEAFEREYRTRLRAYLEGQLRELDGSGGSDDSGVGVPVGAGGAAVGRPEGGAVRISGPTAPAEAAPLRAVPAADPAGPDPAAPTA